MSFGHVTLKEAKNVDKEVIGSIVSNQLADFPGSDVKYGYITIETDDKRHIRFKVDKYTKYDSLDVGKRVKVQFEDLGNTEVTVSRKITAV
jgi:uncharacterized OB-fold protein